MWPQALPARRIRRPICYADDQARTRAARHRASPVIHHGLLAVRHEWQRRSRSTAKSAPSLCELGKGVPIDFHASTRHLHRFLKVWVMRREADAAFGCKRRVELVANAQIESRHDLF